MKRRAFLVGAAALCAVGGVAWRFQRSSNERAIADILKKRLDYLQLDESGVQRFAHDFAERKILNRRLLNTVDALWPIYRYVPLKWHYSWATRANYAEERIVSNYLIATDFFANGADYAKPVMYLGYYDAMTHACANPFKQLVAT
jgi:hypothetical protein